MVLSLKLSQALIERESGGDYLLLEFHDPETQEACTGDMIEFSSADAIEMAKWILGKVEEDVVDWKQTAKDSLGILCDSGDLLRECREALTASGDMELAAKVRVFCDRVHESMVSGTRYESGIDSEA